jgi:hypothetical protein
MGRRIIRCCADRWLPGDRLLGYLRRRESDGKLAAAAAKLWQDRAQLRVLFLNGEPPLQRRVLRASGRSIVASSLSPVTDRSLKSG